MKHELKWRKKVLCNCKIQKKISHSSQTFNVNFDIISFLFSSFSHNIKHWWNLQWWKSQVIKLQLHYPWITITIEWIDIQGILMHGISIRLTFKFSLPPTIIIHIHPQILTHSTRYMINIENLISNMVNEILELKTHHIVQMQSGESRFPLLVACHSTNESTWRWICNELSTYTHIRRFGEEKYKHSRCWTQRKVTKMCDKTEQIRFLFQFSLEHNPKLSGLTTVDCRYLRGWITSSLQLRINRLVNYPFTLFRFIFLFNLPHWTLICEQKVASP